MRRGVRPNRNVNSSIQDLDRELDLLRRKREMLETEYRSNQTTRSANTSYDNQYSDYASLYDRGERARPAPAWQAGAKRPAPSPWADGPYAPEPHYAPAPYPKRRRGPRGGGPTGAMPPTRRPAPTSSAPQPRRPDPPKPQPTKERKDLVLKEGEVPPLLRGRLELCLGEVLKDMRQRHAAARARLFDSPAALKALKARIRARIHACMLNKEVGPTKAVLAEYTRAYPQTADEELLTDLESAEPADTVPEVMRKRFAHKMNIAVNERAEKLFTKLKTLLEDNENPTINQLIQELVKEEVNGTPEIQPEETTTEQKITTESVETSVVQSEITKDTNVTQTDTNVTQTDTNVPQTNTNGGATEDAEKANVEVKKEPSEVSPEQVSAVQEMMVKAEKGIEGTVDTFVKLKLKVLANAVAGIIYASLKADKSFNSLKESFVQQAIDKLTVKVDPQRRTPLHYVMIVGRPRLPKRPVMQAFLARFSVVSLKKHKSHGNLLYVGMTDRSDFDELLKANDSMIGTVKLSIKASNGKKKEYETTADASAAGVKTEMAAETKSEVKSELAPEAANEDDKMGIIDSNLDEQITNLISSIRNDTEYNKENVEESIDLKLISKEENDENAETAENSNEDAVQSDNVAA